MKQLSRILTILMALMMLVATSGCSDKDDKVPAFLTIEEKTLNFSPDAASREVMVKTSIEGWSATVDGASSSWLSATRQGNRLIVSLLRNEMKEARKGEIKVTAEGLTEVIEVQQLGLEPAILLNAETFKVGADGKVIDLEVTSNVDYEIVIPSDVTWITAKGENKSRSAMVTKHFSFDVKWNLAAGERRGELIVQQKGGNLKKQFAVIQSGNSEYEGGSTEGIKDDIKVRVASGQASSFQQGEGIEKSFDGDMETIYHSNWTNTVPNYFPITLDYNFKGEDQIDYLVYHPRPGGGNGTFKEVEIWVKTKDHPQMTKLYDFDFQGSGAATRVDFSEPLMQPETVRFIVKSGTGHDGGFASCAEMEFYTINPDNLDLTNIFTDMSASELRPEVTLEDIEKIENSLYRNIALHMLQGSYPREFRIATYKPYPHPNTWAAINKTSQLNLLDNPTGIRVNKDEELVVFVDDTHNNVLSIVIHNLDKPDGDGYYDAKSYPLAKGVNRITPGHKGLVYVLYHTANYEEEPAVKIHFATGEVNGYFDSAQHDASEWDRLLGGATDKFFDVLGEHAHITFPVSYFRKYTPDGKALIDAYDELVYMEKEFMGLMKYNRPTINRNYFHAMYTSFMYATSYRTAYNVTSDEVGRLMTDVNQFKKEPWGPAHEVGHTFQTRPGFLWHGMTEVTNNVHSIYVQTQWGNPSRLQTESMGRHNNRYEKAYSNSFVKGVAHPAEEDVFCKLVSLWQLQLYFSDARGMKDTYKDLYEHVRVNPNLPNAEAQQLEFVKTMSMITGRNLVPFFKKWGYLTPVKVDINDYGDATVEVTQRKIDETIAAVEAQGYPAMTEALEYICDENVSIFRDRLAMHVGSVTLSGTHVTVNNTQNAVAYEVYEGDRLVFVSNHATFDLDGTASSNTKVYAVSYDGERVLLN